MDKQLERAIPAEERDVTIHLPKDRMPEAEVILRLAFNLLHRSGSHGSAEVSIDGAMVALGDLDAVAES